jgi:endo-1,4-beta-xylanase
VSKINQTPMKYFLALLLVLPLSAIQPPAGGTRIATQPPSAYVFASHGKQQSLPDGVVQMHVTKADPSQPFAAQHSVTATAPQKIAKGSPLLAIIRCRSVDSPRATLIAKWQHGAAPYPAFSSYFELALSREWQDYPVLLMAESDIASDRLQFILLAAQQVQRVEISRVELFHYPPKTDVSHFPRTRRTYEGREPNAPWRKAAQERIETMRKANLSATFVDEKGQPLARKKVTLDLKRHAFGFGSAVNVDYLTRTTPDAEQYRRIVEENFSMVVFENDLKDFPWEPKLSADRKKQRNDQLNASFQWLKDRHIAVRGHYLMQTARPHNLHGKDAAFVKQHFLDSTRERMNFVGDRVCEWDVINHPVAWQGADLLTKQPGLERLDREVFDLARSLSKGPFFVNEDQIFRPGPQSDGTYEYLAALKKEGYPVAGLGNQAHFDESFLPSPMEVLAMTDRFAQVVPKQIITEYDVVTSADEELAADFTRDLLIATFSHPAYHGFLLWGFWEGSHWKPQAASWNRDWSIRLRGQVFLDLINREWHTRVELTTDNNGKVSWRGFPGWYQADLGETRQWIEAK